MWASQCAASVATHEPTGESRAVQCGRQPPTVIPYLQIGEHIGGTRTIRYSTVQYSTVQYSTVQYRTVQYSTAPPCRPPYIFLRQGGHPPVDPPPGYTRKYQDTHTRARTAAGCAVVKTGGTPPCRPPYIFLRQGGHPLSTPRLDIHASTRTSILVHVLQQAVRLLRQGGHPPVDPPIFYEDRGDTPLSTPRLDIHAGTHDTHSRTGTVLYLLGATTTSTTKGKKLRTSTIERLRVRKVHFNP